MGGGLMQLVATGAQDVYLTGNPQITFFKIIYRRHTNFSMEVIQQTVSGIPTLNSTSNETGDVIIARNGDLLGKVYVRCDQDSTNGISGDNLIKEVTLEIGGQEIDKHNKEWLQVWAELSTPESKAAGYKYMTGGQSNPLVTAGGTNQQSIIVPLQFYFCRNMGLALPLIALQYSEIKFKFTWGTGDNASRDGSGATPTCEVWAQYIYLDTEERRRFAQVSHEYLIEQLQFQEEGKDALQKITLNFNHPVKELIWTTAPEEIVAQKMKLTINGHDRFTEQKKEYFQLTQPMEYHTSVPGFNIKETERPQLLTTPIVVASGTAASVATIGTTDNTFEVIASSTSNLKLYSASASDIDIKVGDTLNISYPVVAHAAGTTANTTAVNGGADPVINSASEALISINVVVKKIFNAPADNSVAIYTVGFAAGMGTANTPLASVAGAGTITVIARCQDPQSRCSQLAREINVYSFALKPEEQQPSGTCNFSRIDTASLRFDTSTGNKGNINIYAVNYNILRIMSGMGGLAYSN